MAKQVKEGFYARMDNANGVIGKVMYLNGENTVDSIGDAKLYADERAVKSLATRMRKWTGTYHAGVTTIVAVHGRVTSESFV